MLCLDVGNSQLFGGVFLDNQWILTFRHQSAHLGSSDELGVFLRSLLREHEIVPQRVTNIRACSVVPSLNDTLTQASERYFHQPISFLTIDGKHDLVLNVTTPTELGADRLTNAIATSHLYPNQNAIIIDMGTATTVCALTADKVYLGGAILPGMGLSMRALSSNTALLPTVPLSQPPAAIGKDTITNIQSGLYYGQLGALERIVSETTAEAFEGQKPLLIGTGGYASLFAKENFFDVIHPELVLEGLRLAL